MKFTLREVAEATGGRVGNPTANDREIVAARTDSREVSSGDLFVAIVAERDGHAYIDTAVTAGASGWLTHHDDDRSGAVVVADTAIALSDLGRAARARLAVRNAPVIGVTGSSGKTSTKDLIRGVLRAYGPAGASEKSFNNELGVPLTLVNAPSDAWAMVIEMGARGIGHIATLCEVAQPTIGVVTNVGTAHLEMYDSPQGVILAKGELIESLPSFGTAILNRDDPSLPHHEKLTNTRVLTFSAHTIDADMFAEGVALDEELRGSFRLRSPWGSGDVQLQARGQHQVLNALAAAGACLAAGTPLDVVLAGLGTADLSPWRMEINPAASGATVINDAYNANDQSMAAALRSLAAIAASRRFAVLGTMAELGTHGEAAHAQTVELAISLGIDEIIAVAEPRYSGKVTHVADRARALALLAQRNLGTGDAVLVKGSRVAGLEQLAADLLAEALPAKQKGRLS
jgi:UDP-N-acetylmuramoyl-tripeptide--D-alanyl-D-alanine ligase